MTTPDIDWQTVTLNLRAAGCPLAKIKSGARMDDRTIHRLQRGEIAEPRFSQGLALLDLHVKWCAEKHDFKKIGKGYTCTKS